MTIGSPKTGGLQRLALAIIEQVAVADPDEQVEHSAVFILGQVRSETSIPALRHAAAHGKMDDTRHTARYALKKMGQQTEALDWAERGPD